MGAFFALLTAVVFNVLPGPAAVTPTAAADTSGGICFLDSGGQPVCPPAAAWPQPPLLNPAVYDAATPQEAQALRDAESRALNAVLADHQLPATDLPQVKSYARPDAQAEMWALIVDALKTPADQRSQDQQGLVDWMSDEVTQQRFQPAANAALEYARFAGMDLGAARSAVYNDSQQQLTDFLSAPAEPFDNGVVDALDPRPGGYCQYHPPSPYTGDYDEHTLQTCFTPCQSPLGCTPPTPTFDDFVRWGQATYDPSTDKPLGLMSTPSFTNASAAIALGTVYGSAAAVTGAIALSASVLNDAIAATELASTIFEWAGVDMWAAAAEILGPSVAPFVPIVGEFAATVLGGVVGVVIANIAILATVGVQVANIDQLPGKLAAYVVQSRARLDASTLVDSPQASTLFSLFVAATLPAPKVDDPSCDASGISTTAANFETLRDGSIVYWPLGADKPAGSAGLGFFDVPHCLNPVPVRSAAFDDPHFVVTDQSTGVTEDSTSITVAGPDSMPDAQVRVSGSWFVGHQVGGTAETQSLALTYTDWSGDRRVVWLDRTTDGDYQFFGVQAQDGKATVDKDTCLQDGSCFKDSEIHYVGPDGDHYSAHLAPYVTPPATTVPSSTGTPGYSTDTAFTAHAVSFTSGGFAPPNAVGPMSYSWRFQKDGCGQPCQGITPSGWAPAYTDPVSGPSVSHTWQTSGTYQVELTATDSNGLKAVTTLDVRVKGVPPTLTVAKDCRALAVQVACNDYPTSAGDVMNLFGGVTLAGTFDNVRVWVDWGDGSSGDYEAAGDHILTLDDHNLTLTRQDAHTFLLHGTHTYAAPGYYHVVVHAVNQAVQSDTKDFQEEISGPSTIAFPKPDDATFGQTVPMHATGSPSGIPVTYTAGPADVCRASDDSTGSRVSLVGVGTCTVTAHQAGGGPIYGPADPVSRSFQVKPAPLTVAADDATKVYGAPDPTYTAHVTGLVNGDKPGDLTGLTFTGPPSDSGVGTYDIVPSGVSDPHYTVTYLRGHLKISRAPLTVTPDDQTRVFGGAQPAYTATFEGLVNGDAPADIVGLQISGAPSRAHVGTYPITAAGGTNPNYDITYRQGTETVTPAPLTVTANDVTRPYGTTPTYTASYAGLVNGDVRLPGAGVTFSGAPAKAGVGSYPIVPSGSDPDYDITFVNGTDTVTPAPLTIQALDQTRKYGDPAPAYTASVTGLRNGDTQADLAGLTFSGAPAKAGVGSYPITPSGVSDPNYDITYADGTETVTKAPLTITADDKRKVYGAADPTFTASFDGLVNGDDRSAVTGLDFATAPTGSGAGYYAITPQHATSPDYDITFVDGVETISPAPLTIRAEDKTVRYGSVARYTWKGQGWVNGDSDATIASTPSCQAMVGGVAASATTAPGAYAGAIFCAGATDPNYLIDYAAGRLTVDPVIRLDETGLPSTVPHRATIDRAGVSLPTGDVEMGFGTAHAYSFPGVVVDANGVPYMTRTPGFSGTVTANLASTASYTTMTSLVSAAAAGGGIDPKIASTLISEWSTVQADIKAGSSSRAQAAVRTFAGTIRAQSGKKIKPATASTLLAYAQLVYTFVGGTGAL